MNRQASLIMVGETRRHSLAFVIRKPISICFQPFCRLSSTLTDAEGVSNDFLEGQEATRKLDSSHEASLAGDDLFVCNATMTVPHAQTVNPAKSQSPSS